MAEILALVSNVLKRGEGLVLARIVSDRGSTPRSAGARMIVLRSGEIIGTIGGGLVEAMAMQKAREAFDGARSVVCEMDMTSDDAAGTDMICGGRLGVFCEYIPADQDAIRIFDAIETDYGECRKNVLCTQFEDCGQGLRAIRRFLLHEGVHEGPSISPNLADRLRETSGSSTGSALLDIDGGKYLIDVVESMASLFIFGAGHVGKETAALGVNVGFKTVALDDRAEFANAGRFPAPIEVVALDSFAGCFDNLATDENSYIVIVTRGHAHDKTVLAQALRTDAGYIGMIGSRRKRDAIYKALLAEGFTPEDLKRVHCPIGLAIDTDTPEEIAVSIAGELIDLRARKRKWTRTP